MAATATRTPQVIGSWSSSSAGERMPLQSKQVPPQKLRIPATFWFSGSSSAAEVGTCQAMFAPKSIQADGCIQLLVRQVRHEGGLGLASGWLTAGAQTGDTVQMRLAPNPAFALVDDDAPCIFIGNGSGYAGLRSHLRERVQRAHARNWLMFGERQAAHDAFCAADAAQWRALGMLARADLVYSRDQPERRYVQHCLGESADELRRWIADGAIVYVCGSREGLAPGVDAALSEVLGADGLDALIAQGRYRRDVY